MAQLLNYTPHPIHILDGENNLIRTIESSGLVRLKTSTLDAGYTVGNGIPVSKTIFGEPFGLPEMQIRAFAWGAVGTFEFFSTKEAAVEAANSEEDVFNRGGVSLKDCSFEVHTYYIVSQLVKSALPERIDLLVPAEVQRDEKGNIIGCRSLGI